MACQLGQLPWRHKQLRLAHHSTILLSDAGASLPTVRAILGQQRLNAAMIYARVHDRTVAEDYYAAIEVVEKRLEVAPPETEDDANPRVSDDDRAYLLELATRLAESELDVEMRLVWWSKCVKC
jgi:hypothetical protein